MPGFEEVNAELLKISEEISTASFSLTLAMESYLKKQYEYECEYAKAILEAKAQDADKTQLDLKSEATMRTATTRMELVVQESHYKAIKEKLRGLYARLEATREVAFNLRKEASISGMQ